jgi:serine/threonine-protein kinase
MADVYGGRWKVSASLSQGGQAHTYVVTDLSDGKSGFVLKRLTNVNRMARFEREVGALKAIRAPGIPQVVDHGIDGKGRGYLVTPFLGVDLTRTHLPDEARSLLILFREITTAIATAHAAGIIHRDMKPDNVVLDESANTVAVIDFGICVETSEDRVVLTTLSEGFGNRSFAAPECEAGSPDRATTASDIYGLGKLLFWMTSKRGLLVRERIDPARISA